MANQIILWRHGQTDWNVANKFQGHTDIPLNEVGKFQAAHAAPLIAAINPTMIIASDLDRAQKTAHELVKLTGLEVLTDERLRETNCGNWEGLTGEEIRKVDLDNLRQWSLGGDNPAGGIGERRSEVGARAVAAITDALVGKDNQRIVVATHGGTARTIIGSYLELPIPFGLALVDFQMHNGRFLIIHLRAGCWSNTMLVRFQSLYTAKNLGQSYLIQCGKVSLPSQSL